VQFEKSIAREGGEGLIEPFGERAGGHGGHNLTGRWH
jgi:hypothetical protein